MLVQKVTTEDLAYRVPVTDAQEAPITVFQEDRTVREYISLISEQMLPTDRLLAYPIVMEAAKRAVLDYPSGFNMMDTGCIDGNYSRIYATEIPGSTVFGMDMYEPSIRLANSLPNPENLFFQHVTENEVIRFDLGRGPQRILMNRIIAAFVLSSLTYDQIALFFSKCYEVAAPGCVIDILIRHPQGITATTADLFENYSHLPKGPLRDGALFTNILKTGDTVVQIPNRRHSLGMIAEQLRRARFSRTLIIPIQTGHQPNNDEAIAISNVIMRNYGDDGFSRNEVNPSHPLYARVLGMKAS